MLNLKSATDSQTAFLLSLYCWSKSSVELLLVSSPLIRFLAGSAMLFLCLRDWKNTAVFETACPTSRKGRLLADKRIIFTAVEDSIYEYNRFADRFAWLCNLVRNCFCSCSRVPQHVLGNASRNVPHDNVTKQIQIFSREYDTSGT